MENERGEATMKLGLIGEKLPHSYSKEIFEEILCHPSY